MKRRALLQAMAGASATSLLPIAWWRTMVFAGTPALPGPSPYGALQPADANGIELPVGFTSRVIATTGQPVAGTSHVWHSAPDGGGCVADGSGGWVYTSNAELEFNTGGTSAVRFAADGSIVDAYTILSGTSLNCAGGMTPWATWLSCEERGAGGKVHECNPFEPGQGIVRPLLGSFNHEAAAVDPATGDVYLTEDHAVGRLYKFVPTVAGDLAAGSLFAASVAGDGAITWMQTSSEVPDRNAATTPFAGGEGIHIGNGVVYVATKIDKRVWEIDLATSVLSVAYDCLAHPEGSLNAVDNLTIHPATGRVFVAEDGGNMEIGVISGTGDGRTVAALCRLNGNPGSETTGLAFSPDGTRLYFSSQREIDGTTGVTFEITGPFAGEVVGNQPVTLSIANGVHVRGGTYADSNFANYWSLQVCNNSTEQYERWSLLSTPITPVAGPYERAVLRVNARMWKGGPSPMDVDAIGDAWDPQIVTWNTQPAVIGTPIARFDVASSDAAWYEIDVTNRLNELHAAGSTVAAFSIRQAQRNGPMAYIQSPSANVDRPELVLTSGAAPPPTPTPTPTTTTTTTTTTTLPPSTETVTIDITNDTYTRGGTYTDTSFESSRLLQVCNNGNEQYERWGHLSADLPAMPRPVQSAVLRINTRVSSGGPSAMSITRTAAGWSDSTVTWANRPTPVGAAIATFDVVDTDSRWYDLDVTALVEALRVESAGAFAVVVRQEQRNGRVVYVNPSNHWTSDRPQLVVTY